MDSYTSNDLNELSMTGIGSLLGATEEDINALEVRVSTNESNITTLQNGLATELIVRTNADNALQTNINNEASTRLTNDNTLQTNIDTEASTRLTNDNTLQTNIDDEETARIAGDALKVNKSGDTMTGDLTVSDPNEIYYKGETLDARFHSLDNDYYTEAESDARFVNVAGDTMTGDLNIEGGNIKIFNDTANVCRITMDEALNDSNIVMEYNGSGTGAGNYFALYSGVPSWVGLGDGFNYIPSNGRVGIGLNNPSEKLEVNGNTVIGGNLKVKGNSSNNLQTTWNTGVSQFEVEYPTGTGLFFNNALSSPSLRLLDTKVQVYNGLDVLNGSLNIPNAGIDVAGSINIGYGQINANATFFDIATTNNTDYTFRVSETTSIFRSNVSVNGALTTTDAVQANEFIITNSTTGNTTRLGYLTLGGTYGVYIGHRAGGLNTNTQNTAVGYECMYSSTVARYSVCMGFRAGYHNRGDFNNFIGINAGYGTGGSSNPITGDYNIGIGYQTLQSLTTGYNNVCIGINSTTAITTGYRNVCLGDDTLRYSTTGQQNTVMGQSAMRGLNSSNPSNGSYNVAIGLHSQIYSSTGFHNTSVGYESMNGVGDATKLITGNYNTCIGRRSLFRITSGIQNTALGYMAMGGDNSAGVSGNNNVCVGMFSGYNITNGGYNTFLGYDSGRNSTGSNNLFIGYSAGSNTSSVSHRVGIGFDAEPTEEKEILITAGASDKNQFQMLTDGMRWIFNGSTKMLMEIVSSVATYNFYGNLKVWIGNINTTGMYMVDDNPLLNVSFCAYQSDANPSTNTYINLHFLHPYVGSGESHLASTNAIRVAVFPRAFKIYAICLMLDDDTDMPLTTVKVEVFGNNKGTGSTTNTEVELEKDTSTQKTVVKNLTTPIEVPYGCFSAEVKHSTTNSNEGCVYFYGTQV